MRIDKLKEDCGITVKWVAFPLHPEVPDEGWTWDELFPGRQIDIPAVQKQLMQVADSQGLPFTSGDMSYNSRKAQVLGKWAEAMGKGHEWHDAAFRAVFAHDMNIAQLDVLGQIAQSVGLDASKIEDALKDETYIAQVDSDWQLSRNSAVTAVPTFIVDGNRAIGAQSYENIKKIIPGCK